MIESKDELRISVVVPVYEGGDSFRRCLSALAGAVPPPYETIVVVEAATDDCDRAAKETGAQVLRTSTRNGPA